MNHERSYSDCARVVYVYVDNYCVHVQMTTVHCMYSLRMFFTLHFERLITLTKRRLELLTQITKTNKKP